MMLRRVIGCARCGNNHYDLEAKKFESPFAPPEAQGLKWTHWAKCPTNGDPILVMLVE